jgi:phosphoglycolate phosphatase
MSKGTIVFDFDGTLVNSAEDIAYSFQQSFLALGLTPPSSLQVYPLIGRPLAEMFAVFADTAQIDALVSHYRQIYPEYWTRTTRFFPGVAEVLLELRSRGYSLAVATSKASITIERIADALRITPLFDHLQGTDDIPHKPAPDVIHQALAPLSAPGLWMVGDTTADILAGRAAGLKTYAVSWGAHDARTLAGVKPDRLVGDLSGLLEVLP